LYVITPASHVNTRDRARVLVEHKRFQQVIIWVIVVNAITLGLETSSSVMSEAGGFLNVVDRLTLAIFVVELTSRLYAYGWRFFRDPWNVFDFIIVGISLLPASGPLSVVRTLRVLRVLRLISAFPAMRRVVSGLLSAVPGMAAIGALLGLIVYVAAVMATMLFGDIAPEFFANMGTTMLTLFQIMTGESWPEIAREVMTAAPLAWIFFVTYILVSSFAVLNLFIAVIVSSMEREVTDDLVEAGERHALDRAASDQQILGELRRLSAAVAEMQVVRSHEVRSSAGSRGLSGPDFEAAAAFLTSQDRWAAMSVSTTADDGEPLKEAVVGVLREFGIEVAAEQPPVRGSWAQRFWAKMRDSDAAEGLQTRLKKVEQAIELQQIGKAQAEIDKSKSDAVAVLLEAVNQQDEVVIRIGSLAIVKMAGKIAVWTISESKAAELDASGDLLGRPAQVLAFLQNLDTQDALALAGDDEATEAQPATDDD
jgi:voltage-gated sodium channel